jgi:predicted anti-sigma-YlaC factor YlaD
VNIHDEMRELITLGDSIAEAQQTKLHAHLAECAACRRYAETANQVVATLRSIPVAADARLVRATQMRVRFHAARLREMRERMWFVGMACLSVGFSATLTAPLLWRLFAWMGRTAGIPTTLWQASFLLFCIVPVLAVSWLLLARGTHLGEHRNGSGHGH